MVLIALLVTACSGASPLASPSGPSASPSARVDHIGLAMSTVERAPASGADARAAATAINAFGIDVYRALAAESDNLVFSPTSIAIALGMARPGARGDTAAEMDTVLGELATDENAGWLNSLDQTLAGRSGTFADANGDDADVALRIANATFAQAGFPFEAAYLDALAARFGSGVQLVDFAAETEAARLLINDWIASETEERIPELLAPGILTDLSRLALVNAIYLKAQWHTPFAPEATSDQPFTTADGTTVYVPTMATDAYMGHGEGAGWRAVELAYAGEALAMTVIVPNDLAEFEEQVDGELLATIIGSIGEQRIALTLPRFGVETKAKLNELLAALGMPTAFEAELADFSGITTETRLFIQAVVHQANIDVDEYGTEAAAATAIVIGEESGPFPFKVDRPFIFVVRDRETGAVLFLGRVTDPSIGS